MVAAFVVVALFFAGLGYVIGFDDGLRNGRYEAIEEYAPRPVLYDPDAGSAADFAAMAKTGVHPNALARRGRWK